MGKMTRHHTLYKSEGGVHYPTVDMCEGHQYFVHSTNMWGDEDFDELIPKTKQQKRYIQRVTGDILNQETTTDP